MSTVFTKNAVGALATVIAGADLSATANNEAVLGAAIVPGAAPALEATYRLQVKTATNLATTGAVVAQCWFVRDVGNAGVYENVGVVNGSTTVYPLRAPDFIFLWDRAPAHGSAAIEYMASVPAVVARPACNHKILLRNVCGYAYSTSSTDNVLSEMTVNELGT